MPGSDSRVVPEPTHGGDTPSERFATTSDRSPHGRLQPLSSSGTLKAVTTNEEVETDEQDGSAGKARPAPSLSITGMVSALDSALDRSNDNALDSAAVDPELHEHAVNTMVDDIGDSFYGVVTVELLDPNVPDSTFKVVVSLLVCCIQALVLFSMCYTIPEPRCEFDTDCKNEMACYRQDPLHASDVGVCTDCTELWVKKVCKDDYNGAMCQTYHYKPEDGSRWVPGTSSRQTLTYETGSAQDNPFLVHFNSTEYETRCASVWNIRNASKAGKCFQINHSSKRMSFITWITIIIMAVGLSFSSMGERRQALLHLQLVRGSMAQWYAEHPASEHYNAHTFRMFVMCVVHIIRSDHLCSYIAPATVIMLLWSSLSVSDILMNALGVVFIVEMDDMLYSALKHSKYMAQPLVKSMQYARDRFEVMGDRMTQLQGRVVNLQGLSSIVSMGVPVLITANMADNCSLKQIDDTIMVFAFWTTAFVALVESGERARLGKVDGFDRQAAGMAPVSFWHRMQQNMLWWVLRAAFLSISAYLLRQMTKEVHRSAITPQSTKDNVERQATL